MKLWVFAALLSAVPALAAVPAPVAAEQGAAIANPPLVTIPLTLTARGKAHSYRVEVARTADEQARGLMQRALMARGHGMIFPFDPPREAGFWMEGTILPLDLIFVAPGGTVLRVAADARPFDRTVLPSGGVVVAVLELKAGEATRIGLRPGDRVGYRLDGALDAPRERR